MRLVLEKPINFKQNHVATTSQFSTKKKIENPKRPKHIKNSRITPFTNKKNKK
jgi:hypothetical protein